MTDATKPQAPAAFTQRHHATVCACPGREAWGPHKDTTDCVMVRFIVREGLK